MEFSPSPAAEPGAPSTCWTHTILSFIPGMPQRLLLHTGHNCLCSSVPQLLRPFLPDPTLLLNLPSPWGQKEWGPTSAWTVEWSLHRRFWARKLEPRSQCLSPTSCPDSNQGSVPRLLCGLTAPWPPSSTHGRKEQPVTSGEQATKCLELWLLGQTCPVGACSLLPFLMVSSEVQRRGRQVGR